MSESTKAGGQDLSVGDTENQVNNQEQIREDKVAYETYKKTVAAEKKAKEEARELKAKLQQYEQAELESKGKQAELIDNLRKQIAEENKKRESMLRDFAYQSLNKAVENEAMSQGCVDTEALIKLMDVSAIEVKDDFTVNTEDVKRAIADIKSKKQYLFEKKVSKIADVTPGVKPQQGVTFKLNELKHEDLKKLLAMKLTKN